MGKDFLLKRRAKRNAWGVVHTSMQGEAIAGAINEAVRHSPGNIAEEYAGVLSEEYADILGEK